MSKNEIIKINKTEIEQYLKVVDRLHVRHQVTNEKNTNDGFIVIKLRKQQDYLIDVASYLKK